MATEPDRDDSPQPTLPQRVARRVAVPLTERTSRTVSLLAGAGACAALAPFPYDALGVIALVTVAWELGRKR